MSKNNLELYNKVRDVPKEAQKTIGAGRLSGMTDINPMWRIKKLTEEFGICGFGWRYEITKQWTEPGADGSVCAFVNINLYIKINESWSEPIQGTGGSALVAKERNGLYTNDEAYKMALTDAISIACKALGIAADIYFAKDRTKYDLQTQQPTPQTQQTQTQQPTNKEMLTQAILEIKDCEDMDQLKKTWLKHKDMQKNNEFLNAKNQRKDELSTAN